MRALVRWLASLPTAAKLLLILTAALLPIGAGLVVVATGEIRQADQELKGRMDDQARVAIQEIEGLIARNALALRVGANAGLAGGAEGSCQRAVQSLAIAPALARDFELERADGQPLCKIGSVDGTAELPPVDPGDIKLRIAPDGRGIVFRVGVIGGMATGSLNVAELKAAAAESDQPIISLVLADDRRELQLVGSETEGSHRERTTYRNLPIGNHDIVARIGGFVPRITTVDRLLLLMPVLMWVMAALITWLLVSRLLIRPLRQLQRGVAGFEPGQPLQFPRKVGPATEIRELRDAFERAFARVEQSETEMSVALDGQRRLVREVHHRVKNNLQVIASLLNIQGRNAPTVEARAAFAAIGRRVGALSIVHRNHFAEMEENRGIALRPLITELAAELRAGAPEEARGLAIALDLESVNTTQDVAVAVGFLVTEIVEYAMLRHPQDPIEISLRRSSELTARLGIESSILVPDDTTGTDKAQFERIVSGLAKQLRTQIDRKLGRYCVDLPVFPAS